LERRNRDETLLRGDLFFRTHLVLLSERFAIGVEVEDRELSNYPVMTADVVVTSRDVVDQTLPGLAEQYRRGVALQKLIRGAEEIPFMLETTVQRGDVFRIVGATQHLGACRQDLGLYRTAFE